MALEAFLRAIPKAELHLHLEGSVAPETFAALAAKNGVALPPHAAVADLYAYPDLVEFLKVYDLVCAAIVDAGDFARVTHEALARCARNGARYVEFFFSPHAHQAHGVAYATMLDGITAGMARAEAEFQLVSRLIPAHSRELGPEAGEAFLDMVLADRRPEVIGIGLDYNELPFPPAPFAALYERARAAGLRTTAHAGETGPASYVGDSVDLLGVRRIDHGYRLVEDPALLARCRELGVVFTCCPSTSVVTSPWKDLADPGHAIRRMIEAGLLVTLNTDDPPMFGTDLTREYLLVAEAFGLSPSAIRDLALNGLRGSWLDEPTKAAWLAAWSAEIDRLIESSGLAAAA